MSTAPLPDDYSFLEHAGCRLAYQVRGSGAPVLFIQGVGLPGGGWKPQVDGLADRYRCLTFDNRGMGLSCPAGMPITVERMADDAFALLDTQGWDAAHVVGHSLGGPVAMKLALTHRKRIRSLSLLCTFARGRDVAPLSWRMMWAGLHVQFGPRRVRRRAFLELILPPSALRGIDRDARAAELAPLFGHELGDQPPVVKDQLRAMRRLDATARLGELAGLPTLVVSAGHDPITPPRLGRALATGMPGARFVELPDASHGVTIHMADRVNELLAEHLGTADGGT